ncbi:hypothetical protein OU994_31610 [Pseudoduganella sp. SL102]|uniref:hypothetical protein n=1 Tax=Pseudoduganella sp. SL102 TaxID=2995154 RepID=UPI00248CDC9E|nr:hypothetical protein [Pseudoduganella sp. SL102]WBS02724.1 hypothetical protein OU994_31610 [Pseudoduganella sp. SL102]
MDWVISVTGMAPDRQSPGLTVVGRGTNGGAWRFHVHGPRWQASVARQVLAELCASNPAPNKENQ